MNKERAEKLFGPEVAAFVNNPDFKLIRLISAVRCLRQVYELDPHDVDDTPDKAAMWDYMMKIESIILDTRPLTVEGMKAKIEFVHEDYSLGTSEPETIESILSEAIGFLETQQQKIAA